MGSASVDGALFAILMPASLVTEMIFRDRAVVLATNSWGRKKLRAANVETIRTKKRSVASRGRSWGRGKGGGLRKTLLCSDWAVGCRHFKNNSKIYSVFREYSPKSLDPAPLKLAIHSKYLRRIVVVVI